MQRFKMTSLSAIEQQVVYITTSHINQCGYCIAAHSEIADKACMSPAELAALRRRAALKDPPLRALFVLTWAVVMGKGRVSTADVEAFLAAGFRREQVFESLIGIAAKMLSNFFNQIAGTPRELGLQPYAWSPPVSNTYG